MTQVNLEALKQEYLDSKQATRDAWSAVAWHRVCLWEYHTFDTILKSYQDKAKNGKIPSGEFMTKLRGSLKALQARTRSLPEYEKYRDCWVACKETYRVYLHAKVQERKEREK